MSIAQNIVDIAASTAQAKGADKIERIEVEIGALAGVVTESLEFCFQAVSRGSLAEKAKLSIISIPGKAQCLNCQKEFATDSFIAHCPSCNDFKVDVTQGRELRVRSIEAA